MPEKKYRFYVNKFNKHLLSPKDNNLESLSSLSVASAKSSIPRPISDAIIEDVAESLTAKAVQNVTPIIEDNVNYRCEDIEKSVKNEMHSRVCRFKDQIQEAFAQQDKTLTEYVAKWNETSEENAKLRDINKELQKQLLVMTQAQTKILEHVEHLENKVDKLMTEKEEYIIAESPIVIEERKRMMSERDAAVEENENLKLEKKNMEKAFEELEIAKKELEIDNVELSTDLKASESKLKKMKTLMLAD